jgi:peptidoglycan/LPS O-acetylase OafA/YrhL
MAFGLRAEGPVEGGRRRLAPPPAPLPATRYMPGLDGLRALAVAAVVAYHLDVAAAPGGLLGVGVFFVLSGYLITDQLASRFAATGRLDLGDFWRRRARRLLPALAVMLAVVVAWATLFSPGRLPALRGDVLAAALYASNWWLIFHRVSYFAAWGPPSPLGHLWSLAVEEQFYLLWPFALALLLAHVRTPAWRAAFALAGAAASALAMAHLYVPGQDPSRVYYGTDTRAFSLLTGAALALVWPSGRLAARAGRHSPLPLDGLGVLGLAGVVALVLGTDQYEPFLYPLGLVLLSVASALAVAALAHPSSRLGRVLGWGPLRWLGIRSYGIYLWHYPVIALTTPAAAVGAEHLPRALAQVGASIALAALSWRWVEKPVRAGALGRLWQRVRAGRALPAAPRHVAAAALGAAVLAVALGGMAGAVPAASHPKAPTPTAPASSRTRRPPRGGARSAVPAAASRRPPTRPRPDPYAACRGVNAIGDSVLIDAAPYLEALVPGIRVDGRVGRQLVQAPAVVAALRRRHELGGCVVLELGTNGPFTPAQLDGLLADIGLGRRILLVNTRVPRPWQDEVNAMLAGAAASHPDVRLVDWYRASAGRPQDFWPDGVHLDPAGARLYAELVAHALRAWLASPAPRRRPPALAAGSFLPHRYGAR